ncbi:MAG: Protein serine/threonine phosphatase PrpC, regulation of stationary phase [uncultured Rubrobacteraceae bacterium]|uniref:Protein serine/threonine phosphatase PrpC, regulation of stationary phase n=1 Tax=uncultured Rubrobacteraceae bacterium TaxID=349277 RepID=A0A6J4R6S7_9ACTN|nr:MAG: Protein serine/threonine phosphatase PrpC, regulation of stationary phase [uncultured Rubrobacteraceae bacterium]
MPLLELQPFGVTDPGKVRQNNEDALLVGDGEDETLFVVADGVGGFEAGEVASSIAIDVLRNLGPDDPFGRAIEEANRRILAAGRGDERLSGMGTTVVAVRFGGTRRDPVAELAHVGDSRAYLVRGGELRPVTEDHSLVAELVRSGDLTRDQAAEHPQKNLITRALGAEDEVEVDTAVLPVEAGDRFVLCSDGLTDMVRENGVAEILAGAPEDPEKAARGLLSAALEAGGNDNITVVVIDVKEREEPQQAPPRDEGAAAGGASDGTGDMPALRPGGARGSRGRTGAGRSSTGSAKRPRAPRRPKRRAGGFRRALAALARGLAVVLVVLIALVPAYLWGSSRYYFSFEAQEVVAHQGIPYAPFGVELNREWQRPGLTESEIKEPYEEPIETHKLYTRDEAEKVLADLGK